MAENKRLRVAVLYGGRSGEHEVSLQSAASVIRHLDPKRFEIVPIAIDKRGRWRLNEVSRIEKSAKSLPVFEDAPQVILPPNPADGQANLIPIERTSSHPIGGTVVDVVFPVMHGTFCEDGAIQGLLELADIPYVGCGVLASAVGMDKEMAKRLIEASGISIVPYVPLRHEPWRRSQKAAAERIAGELGYPCFVKPANSGSSVGVHKVKEPSRLNLALEDAFRYDAKVLVEKAIDAREIELSVLENADPALEPLVSVPGEISPTHEFYSYESKYLDEHGAVLNIPAKLSAGQTTAAQRIARAAFGALECEGLARVDLFLDRGTGELYFNEINTLPGFTSISMYPKMWEASGLGYQELLSRLVDLALARHARRKALAREFHRG